MQKKLTILVDETVYDGLHKVIGRRHISQFIEDLVRPHVIGSDLEAGYMAMAADKAREAEALEWAEATMGDVAGAARQSAESDGRPTHDGGQAPAHESGWSAVRR